MMVMLKSCNEYQFRMLFVMYNTSLIKLVLSKKCKALLVGLT